MFWWGQGGHQETENSSCNSPSWVVDTSKYLNTIPLMIDILICEQCEFSLWLKGLYILTSYVRFMNISET